MLRVIVLKFATSHFTKDVHHLQVRQGLQFSKEPAFFDSCRTPFYVMNSAPSPPPQKRDNNKGKARLLRKTAYVSKYGCLRVSAEWNERVGGQGSVLEGINWFIEVFSPLYSMIWLHPPSRQLTRCTRKAQKLDTEEAGAGWGGAKSYDGKRAWPSIKHLIYCTNWDWMSKCRLQLLVFVNQPPLEG
jgi:hypothetical protein